MHSGTDGTSECHCLLYPAHGRGGSSILVLWPTCRASADRYRTSSSRNRKGAPECSAQAHRAAPPDQKGRKQQTSGPHTHPILTVRIQNRSELMRTHAQQEAPPSTQSSRQAATEGTTHPCPDSSQPAETTRDTIYMEPTSTQDHF